MKEADDLMRLVDDATDPSKMTRGQALEVLEHLDAAVKARIDAIHDDMRAKGQDWG